MLSLSSVLLAALTFLSWPSGPRPWLRPLTTSPTELQIGWHTMPQILIQRHNAPSSHTPCTLFNSISLLSILSFISTTFHFLQLSPSPPQLSHPGNSVRRWADNISHLTGVRGSVSARVGAHKAATAERNKGGLLHHSSRGHSDSCRRHTPTDKRPEKQMVCAFMTSLVEAQESPLFKGGFLSAIP